MWKQKIILACAIIIGMTGYLRLISTTTSARTPDYSIQTEKRWYFEDPTATASTLIATPTTTSGTGWVVYAYPADIDTASNGTALTQGADSLWAHLVARSCKYTYWGYQKASGLSVQLVPNYYLHSYGLNTTSFHPDSTYTIARINGTFATFDHASTTHSYVATITPSSGGTVYVFGGITSPVVQASAATINTASIGTALSIESGGSLRVGDVRWDDGSNHIDDDAVYVGATALKAYIDAQDDVCLTQEDCLGDNTVPYAISGHNEAANTDEWLSPIKLLAAMCLSDTAYYATWTSADPTRATESAGTRVWISGAASNSSIFMFPLQVNSPSGPRHWPTYTIGLGSGYMDWYALPTATPGCVSVYPGMPSTNVSNDNTVTFRILAVPPIGDF